MKAEEKQPSVDSQLKAQQAEGAGEATEAVEEESPADDEGEAEAGMTQSEKLERFILFMLIAGVVGGLGILAYRLYTRGERPVEKGFDRTSIMIVMWLPRLKRASRWTNRRRLRTAQSDPSLARTP